MRIMKKSLSCLAILALLGCAKDVNKSQSMQDAVYSHANTVSLSPENWASGIKEAYYQQLLGKPGLPEAIRDSGNNFQTISNRGVISTTSNPLAVHAGIEALENGGTSMDAALTVAMSQVVLHAGGATSFAGQISLVHFDAESGGVEMLNGGYATVKGETDPLGIPIYGAPSSPSGRAILVPGFMAASEMAHERYGKLPWASLFDPAIYFAENGFPVSEPLAGLMQARSKVLTRLPSGREIFTNKNGELWKAGDTFKQSQLAHTLKNVVKDGASYMYQGPWAEKLVAGVQGQGGKMTLEDLTAYKPEWFKPYHAQVNGYDVYGTGGLLEVLRLAELAEVGKGSHYTEDPEALFKLIKISRISQILGPRIAGGGLSDEEIENAIPGLKLSPDKRYTAEMAKIIHDAMGTPEWKDLEAKANEDLIKAAEAVAGILRAIGDEDSIKEEKELSITDKEVEDAARPNHTAGIVAIDAEGNMTAIVHSVTSGIWGEVGLFVDGVSVVDPGAFMQYNIANTGPGKLMNLFVSQSGCPAIALKNGMAAAGCGSVGASYDSVSHQGMVNILLYGLSPEQASNLPMFRKNWPANQPVYQPLGEGEFSAEILDAVNDMGIPIKGVIDPSKASSGGMFASAGVEAESGKRRGGVTSGVHSRMVMDPAGLVKAQ